ncbi:MAG: H/ACA RNA-protein complex component Gar1 [Candidatus Bathyarchaeota archaeon BA1]|nr:MAG: H/ACA RNA-protein complex component Gar1 [Candidatus Bathyarchaeota archaeon BA1]
MQRIGCVLHISSNRHLIVKAENLPRIGDLVVDEHLKPVGMVFDIFGPTTSPYVAVKPDIEGVYRLVNHILYSVPPPKPKVEKRR